MSPHKERRRSTGDYPICVESSSIVRHIDVGNDNDARGNLLRQHESERGFTSLRSYEDTLRSGAGASSADSTTIGNHLHQKSSAIFVCNTSPTSPHQTYHSPPTTSSSSNDSSLRIIAALREQLATSTTAAQRFESIAQTLRGQLTELQETSRELNDENDDLVNDIHDTTQEIDELREQLDDMRLHCSILRSKCVSLRNEKEALEEALEISREEDDNLDPDEIADLMDEIRQQMKRKVREVVDEKNIFEKECQRLTAEKQQMRDDLEQCMNEKVRVEERLREALDAAENLRREIETDEVKKLSLPETKLTSMAAGLDEARFGEVRNTEEATQQECSIEQEAFHEERSNQYEEEGKHPQKKESSRLGTSGTRVDSGSIVAPECALTKIQRRRSSGDLGGITDGFASPAWRSRQSPRKSFSFRNQATESLDSWNRRDALLSQDYQDANKSSRQYLSSSGQGNCEEASLCSQQLSPQPHPAQKEGSISNQRQRRHSFSFSPSLPIQRFLSKSKRQKQQKQQLSDKRRSLLTASTATMKQNSLPRLLPQTKSSQPPQLPPQPQKKQHSQKNLEKERLSTPENETVFLRRPISKKQSSRDPEQFSSQSPSFTDNSHATSPPEGVRGEISARMGGGTSLGSSNVGLSSMLSTSSASTMRLHDNTGVSILTGAGGGERDESCWNPVGVRPCLTRRDSSLMSIDSSECWIDTDGCRKDTLVVEFGPGGLGGIDDSEDEVWSSSSSSSSDGSTTFW